MRAELAGEFSLATCQGNSTDQSKRVPVNEAARNSNTVAAKNIVETAIDAVILPKDWQLMALAA
jgi:uncharacterized surface protein with fasciclin (FAS1) repeats